MDARLQLLLDKDELRELVILYAHRILVQDWRGISELFIEDGVLDYSDVVTFARPARATAAQRGTAAPQRDPDPSLVFVGRRAICDFLPAVGRLEAKAFFSNHLVRVTGDEAVGISCFENRLTQQGESVIGAGRMIDEYRRVDRHWLISYRRQELYYFTGLREGWAEGADRDRPPAAIARRPWEAELLGSWKPGT